MARRSNQSVLKEISPEYSLQGLMLKLKLQYFGHLMGRANSFEKTLMLERVKDGGEGDNRRWDHWMASPALWTWVWVNAGSWWWTGRPGVLQSTGSQRVGHDWVTELNWTELFGWKLGVSASFSCQSSQYPPGCPLKISFSADTPNLELFEFTVCNKTSPGTHCLR